MNAIPESRPQAAASRFARGVGVAALSTILVVGLAGCMTGRVAPDVRQNAQAPAGVDLSQPADRIADQLALQAAMNRANSIRFEGRPADRVAEALAREAQGTQEPQVTQTNPYAGMPADRAEYRIGLRQVR